MSGEKCAVVSLDNEIREQIQRLMEARALRSAGAHAREEATSALAIIARDVRQYMAQDWEDFQRLQAGVDSSAERVQQAIQAAEGLTISTEDVAGPLSAAREARTVAQSYRQEAGGLRERARGIASRRVEAIDSARREELVASLKRARVASLRASFESEASRLRKADPPLATRFAEQIMALERALGPLDEDIARCEEQLGALVARAQAVEQENWERWEIGRRVSDAFCQSGYTQTEGIAAPPPTLDDPARWKLELKDGQFESITDVNVPKDKRIQLIMRGRAGSEEVTMAPACDAKLDDVIRRAKELGITIQSVLWKDPDGGWREMYADPAAQSVDETRKLGVEGEVAKQQPRGPSK